MIFLCFFVIFVDKISKQEQFNATQKIFSVVADVGGGSSRFDAKRKRGRCAAKLK
jgi:hypothetical protein